MNLFIQLGNAIIANVGFRPILRNIANGEQDDDAVTVGQLKSTIASPIMANLTFKGFGNTDFQNVENGDYRIIANSSNELVTQYYTSGAWDSANETILATPS
jgi:stress response protein SCP2